MQDVSESKVPNSTRRKSSAVSAVFLKFEELLEKLGGFGYFHILLLILLLSLEIPVTFVTFLPIFISGKGSWACINEGESEYPNDVDEESSVDICGCNGTLISLSDDTIVGEWGLVCDKSWVADFILSIQMLGMLFGNLYGSKFADWYGRKKGFLLSTILLASGSVISAIAPNPFVYAAARFFCGMGIPAFINITCMAVMEFMPPEYRSLSNSVGPTGEGMMILSLLAYLFRPWRTLIWIAAAPFTLILIIYPFVPESPRWLLRNGRVEDAYSVMKYMAKINGGGEVSLDNLKAIHAQEVKEMNQQQNFNAKRFGYLDFFREKELRKSCLFLMAIWFSWSMTYYGVSYNIKNVKGDIYLNVLLLGLANALGQRFAILINNRIGRRHSLFAGMTFCAVFLVVQATCVIFFEASNPILAICTIVFCLLSQLGLSSARATARLLSGESFPTAVRTMGLGMGGVSATFAGVLTPQLSYIGSQYPSIPFFVFGIVSVGGSLVSFLMRETTGNPLSDNLNSNKKAVVNSNVDNC